MKKSLNKKNSPDKILVTAYSIILNVFKKKISTKKSKGSKAVKYATLSSSDKAKCNDLVQKVLRYTVYLDPLIQSKQRGRIRVELFCLLRLALTDILVREVRQETVLKKYSDLALLFERTKHSIDKLRYYIHLGFSEWKKNSIQPLFLFEKKLLKALLAQYSLESVKKVEKIFSKPPYIDVYIRNGVIRENLFKKIEGLSVSSCHFRFCQNVSLMETRGYRSGEWWVQSLSSSLPVKIAPIDFKGKYVLDVCCAPGGKSFQLADRGAILTSIDKSEKRLNLMKENLNRLKYDLDLLCMDVFEYKPRKLFDVILLDPPCSATGTLGKNPDLQFFNPLDKLEELLDIQRKMLELCSGWLTDNGFIIYSVCSLQKEEGENQISRFLKKYDRFSVVHPKKGFHLNKEGFEIHKEGGIRIMPFFEESIGGTEGFYFAYLQLKGKNS